MSMASALLAVPVTVALALACVGGGPATKPVADDVPRHANEDFVFNLVPTERVGEQLSEIVGRDLIAPAPLRQAMVQAELRHRFRGTPLSIHLSATCVSLWQLDGDKRWVRGFAVRFETDGKPSMIDSKDAVKVEGKDEYFTQSTLRIQTPRGAALVDYEVFLEPLEYCDAEPCPLPIRGRVEWSNVREVEPDPEMVPEPSRRPEAK